MPRTISQANHQVSLELSHVTGGESGRRAQLRVIDGPSHLTILEVDIPPDVFYKLLSSAIDGTLLPAKMLTPYAYQRVGKDRFFWTRRIGYGVEEEDARAWATQIGERFAMHHWSVGSRQGGLFATWELWSAVMDKDGEAEMRDAINSIELPAGAH